jgi:tRNA-dihydrouridine synthase A
MMDWTDRHCRYFLRGYSPRVLLYTEMITAPAIVHGDRVRLLKYSPEEQPLALQLGGGDPVQLATAARIGADAGYREINLNCGCPSERVQAGAFGAALMLEPARVAECVEALRAAVSIPVTVKTRIGVIAQRRGAALEWFGEADYEHLHRFTAGLVAAGCEHLIVHARQAVLGGLSPRENREIPPLRFDVVRRLKRDFPALWIGVNGGLRTVAECCEALDWADGVMLGREAYHRPQVLGELHEALCGQDGWCVPDTAWLFERMLEYARQEVAAGTPLNAVTRHMMGLAAGRPGAKRFRQLLCEAATAHRGARAASLEAPAGGLLRQAGACCAA